jgi:hypothetical protein
LRALDFKFLKTIEEELQEVRFFLADCSLKEAKKRHPSEDGLFVVDIGKIIKDLGYDISSLSKESEFVINYSIQKKITQGIYSTKCNGILVVHRNMSESFVKNLEYFLEDLRGEVSYTIQVL